MLNEFKEFAMKGNLVDMAVGFVLGGAFATVVTAFIQGVFLPMLAPILGGIDLASLTYTVQEAVLNDAGEVVKDHDHQGHEQYAKSRRRSAGRARSSATSGSSARRNSQSARETVVNH